MCTLEKIKWRWIRTGERLMSGLSVIDDTCHQMAKQKGDTWEPSVIPLKKDQWWIRMEEGKDRKKGERKERKNEKEVPFLLGFQRSNSESSMVKKRVRLCSTRYGLSPTLVSPCLRAIRWS